MSARRRASGDRLALYGALLLLAAVLIGWWVLSLRHEQVREETLAGVPEFPKAGQLPTHREPAQRLLARPAPAPHVDAGPPPPARAPDRMERFVLAPTRTVMLVQVNALFNTPLFDRFQQCAPTQFKEFEEAARRKGIDLEKDIDRVAVVPGGMAVSGFFEGKPVAELATSHGGAVPAQHGYRDQQIFESDSGNCAAQIGNLLLLGKEGECEPLVDRALDEPADGASGGELYGDLYLRSALDGELPGGGNDLFGQLYSSLSGVTVRANVWDDVALSFEGTPRSADQAANLSQMARGALSVAKGQLGEDDEKLQALADLAQVQSADGKLQIDLALPSDQLFERLHLPCPGLADAGSR